VRIHPFTVRRVAAVHAGIGVLWLLVCATVAAQILPASYVVRLASATSYDTRSRDEDTVHAALTVFVNGDRKGTAVWDGKGWDGSRTEGRRWVTGLHLFGPSTGSTVQVVTGRLQETDTVEVVFHVVSASGDPTRSNHDAAADRIHQSTCTGGDAVSAWDCLADQAPMLLDGWQLSNCDGMLGAEKLVFTAQQLRRKTETGETVTISNNYQGAAAPAACGHSIYGVIVTIARQ
jgi:hypothetical protein